MGIIRRYFLGGLLVWLPILATIFVLRFLIRIFEGSFNLLPESYRPHSLLGIHIPGLGLILAIFIVLVTGALVTNYFGHRIIKAWENILNRIPFVRTIYSSVKQVLQTLFSQETTAFRKVVLVEYPRKGMWSVAFQAGDTAEEIVEHVGEPMTTIFIPTTPNPTSGFLMMLPAKDVKPLEMSVDNALKFIISLGVMQPKRNPEKLIDTQN